MRAESFRRFLLSKLGERSADSYVSNCARIEREAGVDLDAEDLTGDRIAALGRRIASSRSIPSSSLANCLTAVRSYARFRDYGSVATPRPSLPLIAPADAAPEREQLFRRASICRLLELHGQIIDELRARQVVRTANSPLGDYVELLFTSAFGWALLNNSASGHDAVDGLGMRYQIKGRRAGGRGSNQLGAFRRIPERTFDVLAAAQLDRFYRVKLALLIPYDAVAALARRTEHTNSWRLMLDGRVSAFPGVIDVTGTLSQTARTFDVPPVLDMAESSN